MTLNNKLIKMMKCPTLTWISFQSVVNNKIVTLDLRLMVAYLKATRLHSVQLEIPVLKFQKLLEFITVQSDLL